MNSYYEQLNAALDAFEAALRKVARGARFDVEIGDFRVTWTKRDKRGWGLFIERGADTIALPSATIGVRLAEITEAALAAGARQLERVRDAVSALQSATQYLDERAGS